MLTSLQCRPMPRAPPNAKGSLVIDKDNIPNSAKLAQIAEATAKDEPKVRSGNLPVNYSSPPPPSPALKLLSWCLKLLHLSNWHRQTLNEARPRSELP